MAFYSELEQACKDNGIAIIKQAGDTIVINDEQLKAYLNESFFFKAQTR